jgi:hypothetical protein
MLVTQRYPTYFDGVISGDPAMRTGYSNLADAWVTVALNPIAPKDDAGKPVVSRVFSDGDKKLIVNSVLEQCDNADGLSITKARAMRKTLRTLSAGNRVAKLQTKSPATRSPVVQVWVI